MHVLEVLNIGSYSEQVLDTLRDYALRVKGRVSATESAMLLRHIYYLTYFNKQQDDNDNGRSIYRTVLYREEENPYYYTSFYLLMRDYKVNEIRQCFHMSFKDYLDLTSFEKRFIDDFARDWAEQMAKAMRQVEQERNRDPNSHNATSPFDAAEYPVGLDTGIMGELNE